MRHDAQRRTERGGHGLHLSANGSNFVAFRAFTNTPDTGSPAGELSVSGNGFFGTSFGGGSSGGGAVFAGQTNGSVSVLRSFTTVSADNATNSGSAPVRLHRWSCPVPRFMEQPRRAVRRPMARSFR